MLMYLDLFSAFVKEVNADNSRNYKLEILKKWKDVEEVKFYLNYIFNPYITTGLAEKKLDKNVLFVINEEIQKDDVSLLNYIKDNNTGTDVTVGLVKHAVFNVWKLDDESKQLFYNVICKNVQLGLSTLSINKIIPNLIPTFDVMLANKYFDKPEIVEGREFTLTTKIDGGRIIALKHNNIVEFYTRAGQRYEGLVDLENEMLEKLPDDICLDGEITLLNSEGLDNKAQYKQTMMITRKDGIKHGVKMKVFDIMPYSDFINQKSTMVYKDRRNLLEQLFSKVELTFFTKLDNLYTGTDTSQITTILNQQINNGEEGVMINFTDEYYQFKRTDALLKVKKMHDMDLVITGFEEGKNQNEGKLGAFITEYKGNIVKVGTGISKELREEVWKHKEDYLGLTMSVQYFEETTNQNGGISLRFPCFIDFRYDK